MCVRNVWRVLWVMGFLVLLAIPAAAGDNDGAVGGGGQGVCEPTGAWLGVSPGWGLQWTLVYGAGSHWTGPFTLQFIGGDPSFGGVLPATTYSSTTGTWVRTGRRTFEYTMITYGLGTDPGTGLTIPIYIGKNTGISEMSGHCDSLVSTSLSVELYAPDQDPLGDDPPAYGCVPDFSPSPAQRITVDPPCEL